MTPRASHSGGKNRLPSQFRWLAWLGAAGMLHGLVTIFAAQAEPPQNNAARPSQGASAVWREELVVWLEQDTTNVNPIQPVEPASLARADTTGLADVAVNAVANVPHAVNANVGVSVYQDTLTSEAAVTALPQAMAAVLNGEGEALVGPIARDGASQGSNELAVSPLARSAGALPLAQNDGRPNALGISGPNSGLSYHIVQSELDRVPVDPVRAAEQRLDATMARDLLEADRLALTSIDAAARRLLQAALQATSFQATSPVVIRFVATPQGTLEGLAVLNAHGAHTGALDALMRSIQNQPLNSSTPRPVEFTVELSQRTALASGRSAGTGLSIGPINAMRQGAADSPKLAVLPRKNQFITGQVLARDRTTSQTDVPVEITGKTRPVIFVEQTLLDVSADLVDTFTTGERVNQVKVLKRRVL